MRMNTARISAPPQIAILAATPDHVRALGATLRTADKNEIEIFGFPTTKALWRSYKGSIMCRAALVDGEVAAIWGIGGAPMGPVGQPFLLTSPAVENISPLRFARIYQAEVHKMLTMYPRLVNWVANDYDKAIRLLDICGFTIGEPEPLGLNGGLFRKFEIGN